MQGIQSINFLHNYFLKKVYNSSLNSYYYLLSYTKIDLEYILKTTTRLALNCVPDTLKSLPIFLVVDDTLQEKFGVHFECRNKLFDHAKHNGSNYLNGHCFVGLILKIPVWIRESDICYLSISLGYRLKKDNPKKSKLQIASEMINCAMEVLKKYQTVILLCDSWYPKGKVIETVESHNNLELIANVRVDTVIYDLPPEPTGKRGRPRIKGDRLDIHDQQEFSFTKVNEYFTATRKVISNLFKKVVYATVTTPNLDNEKSYRLFISTIMPEQLEKMLPVVEDEYLNDVPEDLKVSLLPYIMYRFRWSIEVVFYEQKKFWSFGDYMLRSAIGVENYVNIINICYSCVTLLPWWNKKFADLKGKSPQHVKCVLSQKINREIFFASFVLDPESAKKRINIMKAVISRVLMKKRL